jgi:hypothetical protein
MTLWKTVVRAKHSPAIRAGEGQIFLAAKRTVTHLFRLVTMWFNALFVFLKDIRKIASTLIRLEWLQVNKG